MTKTLDGMHGVLTALVTPFDPQGGLDLPALKRLVERQLKAGVGGLVACGTTGETACLNLEERAQVVQTVVEVTAGKVPVIAGSGSNDTRGTIEETRRVKEWGADAALVVAPYYNRPTQEGMYAHFSAVAEGGGLPVIAYNVPSRTASDLLPETVARLAKAGAIIGVKEATGSLRRATEVQIALQGQELMLFSGDDFTIMPFISIGGRGVISVVSNLVPKATEWLIRLSRAGMFPEAWPVNQALTRLAGALFSLPNPVPVKAAMALTELCQPTVRSPLVEADAAFTAQLREEIIRFRRDAGNADLFKDPE